MLFDDRLHAYHGLRIDSLKHITLGKAEFIQKDLTAHLQEKLNVKPTEPSTTDSEVSTDEPEVEVSDEGSEVGDEGSD